jgi:hypothetical protein
MRDPQRTRLCAVYFCLSLLGASATSCVGPGLEPPNARDIARSSAGSPGPAAVGDTTSKSGTAASGATNAPVTPPITAPTTPGAEGPARDAGAPHREDDGGTDDSGKGP